MLRNVKGYYKYICSQRKTKENVELLLNDAENLVTMDTKEVKVLNLRFTSIFTFKKIDLQTSQVLKLVGQCGSKKP